jgi:hypothetical protein
LIQILESLIVLNPYFRKSAQECLSSKLFDPFRKEGMEKSAPEKLIFETDQEDAFDYVTRKSDKFDKNDILALIDKEIVF